MNNYMIRFLFIFILTSKLCFGTLNNSISQIDAVYTAQLPDLSQISLNQGFLLAKFKFSNDYSNGYKLIISSQNKGEFRIQGNNRLGISNYQAFKSGSFIPYKVSIECNATPSPYTTDHCKLNDVSLSSDQSIIFETPLTSSTDVELSIKVSQSLSENKTLFSGKFQDTIQVIIEPL